MLGDSLISNGDKMGFLSKPGETYIVYMGLALYSVCLLYIMMASSLALGIPDLQV